MHTFTIILKPVQNSFLLHILLHFHLNALFVKYLLARPFSLLDSHIYVEEHSGTTFYIYFQLSL